MSNNGYCIVLFDGVCNLCIGIVNFIIKRDSKEKFKFAALQSESGQAMLKKFNLPTNNFGSFIFIKREKYFIKSTAGLHVLKEIGGVWKLFYILIIIPRPLRDGIYTIIARTRYRIFGKQDTCITPTPEVRQRFLK